MQDRYTKQSEQQNIAEVARTQMLRSGQTFLANGNRLRMSLTRTLLATRFPYDEQPLIFTQVENVNGSVTYEPNSDRTNLTIGTAAGDKIYRSTNEFFHYQAYRETHLGAGFQMPPQQDGQRCRVGGFYEDNGIYFERDENGVLYCVRRSKASGTVEEERIKQNEWNIDKFDGSGHPDHNPTGIALDMENIQMVKVGFEWYGAGDAWIGFKIDGVIYQCHLFSAGNNLNEPIFGEPTVPLRYEIENVSAVSTSETLQVWGASASVEAGFSADLGFSYSVSNGVTPITVSGTLTRVLTMRLKDTFKGKVNRTKINPSTFELFNLGNVAVEYVLLRNGTITNSPTWTSVNPDSAVEYSVDAAGISDGFERVNGYASGGTGGRGDSSTVTAETRVPLVLDADGTNSQNLALFARSVGGTDVDVLGSLRWVEIQ